MGGRNSFWRTYRVLPIILGSLIIFAVLCAVAILVWSCVVYFSKSEVATIQTLPAIIWLTALFLTSGIMTILTRGGTVFPALFLTVVAVTTSCLLAEPSLLTVVGVMVKLGYSLLFAVLGFIFAKLYVIFVAPARSFSRRAAAKSDTPQLFDQINRSAEESSGFKEYHR
jgi:hypothetical protein